MLGATNVEGDDEVAVADGSGFRDGLEGCDVGVEFEAALETETRTDLSARRMRPSGTRDDCISTFSVKK